MRLKVFILLTILFLTPTLTEAALVNRSAAGPKSGLVGHWTFDGRDIVNGVVRDISGQGNHGNPINIASSTFYATGKIGQGGNFDGVNDVIQTSSAIFSNGDFSGSSCVWVKTTDVTNGFAIFGAGDGDTARGIALFTGLRGTGSISVEFYNNRKVNTGNVLSANTWSHICFTKSPGEIDTTTKIYLNGVLQANDFATLSTTPNFLGTNPLHIGSDYVSPNPPNNSFRGALDDLRIYNRALSATEISRLYAIGASSKVNSSKNDRLTDGLVGLWTMDGADLTTNVKDRSGQGNNGYMTNFTSTTSAQTFGRIGQAMKFDGVDDSVSIPYNASLQPPLPVTVSLWVKPNTTTPAVTKTLFGNDEGTQYSGIAVWQSTSGVVWVNYGNSSGFGSTNRRSKNGVTVLPTTEWTHVVGVIRGATDMDIYINGVNDGGTYSGTGGSMIYDENPALIAKKISGETTYFSGMIDDVRMYNRALSETEIKRLYAIGAPSKVNKGTADRLTDGLVGMWTFDGPDMFTNVKDRSGQGNHGYMLNFTSTTSAQTFGKIGQGLKFDGSDNYIQINSPASLDDLGPMTISAWVYPKGSGENSQGYIVHKSTGFGLSGWLFGIDSGASAGNLKPFFKRDYSTTDLQRFAVNGVVPLNKWSHILVTWDGTTSATGIKIYHNGTEMSHDTPQDGEGDLVSDALSSVQIGNNTNVNRTFDGTLDDVRIYNRLLTASEITQLYNLGR